MVRRKINRLASTLATVAVVAVAVLWPFPTQLSPPMTIQVADRSGGGLTGLPVQWRAASRLDVVEGRLTLDGQGRGHLSRVDSWASLAHRALTALARIGPHQGGLTRASFAEVSFVLPAGYAFSPAGQGLILDFDSGPDTSRTRSWHFQSGGGTITLCQGMDPTGRDVLSVTPDDPASPTPVTYHIVLQSATPAAASQPSTGGVQ
jgi:hypothetical protein